MLGIINMPLLHRALSMPDNSDVDMSLERVISYYLDSGVPACNLQVCVKHEVVDSAMVTTKWVEICPPSVFSSWLMETTIKHDTEPHCAGYFSIIAEQDKDLVHAVCNECGAARDIDLNKLLNSQEGANEEIK